MQSCDTRSSAYGALYGTKLGQGRGAFNPKTQVQIPMGANQIFDDKLGFSSLAKEKKLSQIRFGSITETEPEKLKKHIHEVLPSLTFHEIKDVLSVIYRIKKKRFRGNAPPKYGSLNKGFTEQEVQAFFKVIENDKFRLLFGYQAQLGLRIGEAVKVNVKDIKFETRELTVKTEKAHVIDTMLIPVPLFRQTVEFINRNDKAITQAGGFVFFADPGTKTCRSGRFYPRARS